MPPLSPMSLGRQIERPFQWTCIALVRGYQIAVSPLLPPACRFYPSCSQYALDALRHRRLFVAWGMIGWRLLRCNPLCRGGHDPVKGVQDDGPGAPQGAERD